MRPAAGAGRSARSCASDDPGDDADDRYGDRQSQERDERAIRDHDQCVDDQFHEAGYHAKISGSRDMAAAQSRGARESVRETTLAETGMPGKRTFSGTRDAQA